MKKREMDELGYSNRTTRPRAGLTLLGTGLAVVAVVAAGWGALGVASAAAQEGEGCDLSPGGLCSRTSGAAWRSCHFETKEEYWIEVGKCKNESEDRRDCVADVRSERAESREDCVAQCEARQEVCDALGQAAYDPDVDPADFADAAAIAASPNPFFPLIPGTVWQYEGGDETITVTVTDQTVEILGVTCIVVRDIVEADGEPIEDTIDWYGQDLDGNVWYFGEISQELEDGELVSLDGSWKAGVDGAKPGIIMFADPQIGTVYRQEFFLGEAEDIGEILALDGDESAPAASCDGACLVTADYTPIEPDVLEHKYYKAGVGLLVEVDPDTGDRVELVDFSAP
jgi:hypothetical protein